MESVQKISFVQKYSDRNGIAGREKRRMKNRSQINRQYNVVNIDVVADAASVCVCIYVYVALVGLIALSRSPGNPALVVDSVLWLPCHGFRIHYIYIRDRACTTIPIIDLFQFPIADALSQHFLSFGLYAVLDYLSECSYYYFLYVHLRLFEIHLSEYFL